VFLQAKTSSKVKRSLSTLEKSFQRKKQKTDTRTTPKDPNHTFYFQIDEDRVIDALHGGNSARWINHCCTPNCKPEVDDGRVFIKAKKNISAGEELNYDYGLIIDEPITKKLIAQYPCWCGSPKCRKTLLAQTPKSGKAKDKEKVAEIRKTIKKLKAQLKRLGH
jgi:uncharacterized protein